MDGHVPYVLVPGNHDYGPGGNAADRSTLLHRYFPPAAVRSQPSFGGFFESERLDNSYSRFETPSGPYLVLGLEFGPRDAVVAWADTVLRANADATAILLTHAFLYSDDTRYDLPMRPDQRWSPSSYGLVSGGVNDGQQLFDALVRPYANVRFVLNGHVLTMGSGTFARIEPTVPSCTRCSPTTRCTSSVGRAICASWRSVPIACAPTRRS